MPTVQYWGWNEQKPVLEATSLLLYSRSGLQTNMLCVFGICIAFPQS